MKLAYADPPYPGQSAKHYRHHPDFAGEVDHAALMQQLCAYDGWVLHTSSVALPSILPLVPPAARVMAWVKPFAGFKRNVPVAYAWEPMIVMAARKPIVGRLVRPLRDFLSEPITMKRGLSGAKPEAVCWWAFEVIGAMPDDELSDLFPGSGAVSRAWASWQAALRRSSDLFARGVTP